MPSKKWSAAKEILSMKGGVRAVLVKKKTELAKFRPFAYPGRRVPNEGSLKRRKFDLNVFVAEAWKASSGHVVAGRHFLAMESFSRYISRVDDLIDTPNHLPVETHYASHYKRDPYSRELISDFVSTVIASQKTGRITIAQRRQLFKLAGNYRREAMKAISEFEGVVSPTFSQVLRMKEKTTGGMGAVMADILSVTQKVSETKRQQLHDAFSNSFMASQIVDDVDDVHVDVKNHVANIAVGVLNHFPAEFKAVQQLSSGYSTSEFKVAAPRSYQRLVTLMAGYIQRIPVESPRMAVMQAIPKLLLLKKELTKRSSSD